MRVAAIIGVLVVSASLAAAPAVPVTKCGIEMRNVSLHVADGVILDARAIDGEFLSHSKTDPPIFDDPNSYTLKIRSADLALDAVEQGPYAAEGDAASVRYILCHMIEETARHVGHLDIIRELIDGRTGYTTMADPA